MHQVPISGLPHHPGDDSVETVVSDLGMAMDVGHANKTHTILNKVGPRKTSLLMGVTWGPL